MNRINPLYLGAFLVVLLVFSSFKLSGAKSDLTDMKEAYKQSSKLSTELSGLKKVYSKKVKLSALKTASVVQKTTKTGVILSSKGMNIKELNSLMSKVLNGTYNVTALKVKKLSKTKVSLHMEIKW